MYLVLRKDDQAPAGWVPVTLSGADDAHAAATEGNPGCSCELAVVPWDPELYQVGEPLIVPKPAPENAE